MKVPNIENPKNQNVDFLKYKAIELFEQYLGSLEISDTDPITLGDMKNAVDAAMLQMKCTYYDVPQERIDTIRKDLEGSIGVEI